jgi:hypothetical protein
VNPLRVSVLSSRSSFALSVVDPLGPYSRISRGVPDGHVGVDGDAVTDGLGVDEAHGFLVAGLAEEALAGPEHDREDLQPQLVDEVVTGPNCR